MSLSNIYGACNRSINFIYPITDIPSPVSMVHVPPESTPPPDPTTSEASGAVVGGIIGVLVVALLVTILMVIIVNIIYS